MMEAKRNHECCSASSIFGKNDVHQKLIGLAIGSVQSGLPAAQAR